MIGDEILSGDTIDTNSRFLAKLLQTSGHQLSEIRTIPDEYEVIEETVRDMRKNHRFLLTSGGIGATPDDVTYEAIARVYGTECKENKEVIDDMLKWYKEKLGKEVNKERRRMAVIPESGRILKTEDLWIPLVAMDWKLEGRENTLYILPGVPSLFEKLLVSNAEKMFGIGIDRYFGHVYTVLHEGDFADRLREIQESYPEVRVGSYPVFDFDNMFQKNKYNVKLIIKGDDRELVKVVTDTVKEAVQGFCLDE